MIVQVADIRGLPELPNTRIGVHKWLAASRVPVRKSKGRTEFNLSDLPEDVRLAYFRRELDRLELPAGDYDGAAHAQLAEAAPSKRARAERKAAIAAMLVALKAQGLKEAERFALVRETHGDKGTSNPSLKRLQKAVQGVDPINYAPALLDDYRAVTPRADMSDDAWAFFMTMIRDAAPDWPLKEAWRRVRDAGK